MASKISVERCDYSCGCINKQAQMLVGIGSAQAQEALRQDAALQERLELVFDELRQAGARGVSGLGFRMWVCIVAALVICGRVSVPVLMVLQLHGRGAVHRAGCATAT
jgi:hypothetical protein